MPVTFHPAPENAVQPFARAQRPCTPASLLETALKQSPGSKPVREHLQSSFGRDSAQPIPVVPQRNGFVHTVMAAYNHHHALVIRPDDVWLAIVAQFSAFVNGEGRAEQLRYLFVAHEGKKKLVVEMSGTRHTVDFGAFARLMTGKIHENVVDAELREWCLPDFSTTTPNDTVVASVVMMATLKAYFEYVCYVCCGLPQVTLLGTQADWAKILERVDRLGRYGPETAAWRDLLKPVLARFVKAFEPGYADSAENREFWQYVVDEYHSGSGIDSLKGWITAFCAFDSKGRWQGGRQHLEKYKDMSNSTADITGHTLGKIQAAREYGQIHGLTIDGVAYPEVGLYSVPPGVAEVDVVLIDNGEEFDTKMVAGLAGTAAKDCVLQGSGDVAAEADETKRVGDGEVSPVAAWWMFIV